MKIRLPEGTALIIPPQKRDYESKKADEEKALDNLPLHIETVWKERQSSGHHPGKYRASDCGDERAACEACSEEH